MICQDDNQISLIEEVEVDTQAEAVEITPEVIKANPTIVSEKPKATPYNDANAPLCFNCGNQTQRSGSCYVCTSCGSTTGCS